MTLVIRWCKMFIFAVYFACGL